MDSTSSEAVSTLDPSSSSTAPFVAAPSSPTQEAEISTSNEAIEGGAMEVDEAFEGGEEGGEEDNGIIRCICGIAEDDGFTIQCEQCFVWQHCACMGMNSEASIPEVYYCEGCDPDPVTRAKQLDAAYAQQLQSGRLENERRRALAVEQYTKSKNLQQAQEEPSSGIWSNGQPQSEGEAATSDPAAQSAARSRRPNATLDLTNTGFVMPSTPRSASGTPGAAVPTNAAQSAQTPAAGPRAGTKPRRGTEGRERGGKTSRRGDMTPADMGARAGQGLRSSMHTPRDERTDGLDDVQQGSSAQGPAIAAHIDSSLLAEAWRVEYTPLSRNLVTDRSVLGVLQNAMRPYENRSALSDGVSALRATQSASGKWIVPVKGVRQRSKLDGTSSKSGQVEEGSPEAEGGKKLSDDYNTTSTSAHGLTAVGNECVPVEISAPVSDLSELNLRTYIKQISDSAAAGIFTNVLQIVPLPSEPQRAASASRTFSRPVMHGLFAEHYIPAGSFICEFKGELGPADTYRADPRNMYENSGCTKPHVHLFPPPLNLAIDARRFGNEARFARSSCHPNAVLRPILFRKLSEENSFSPDLAEPELLFGIFSIADISKMHEITLGWEWDDLHIVHLLPQLVQNPLLDDSLAMASSSRSKALVEARQAALVALAERGDFPYASTLFSAKMNSATAVLLGSTLCACIGSASAPSGNISASANNGKKQDCAVAQMLRVGQGMGLLNVQMPGKSSRKSRLPDFKPLVGVKRWWRPIVLPPTPESHKSDPFDRAERMDGDDEDEDMADGDRQSERTDPLSGASEDESSESDDAFSRNKEEDKYVPAVLPPKKRISGTRIKATYSDNEEEDRHAAQRAKLISAASAGASHTRGKRKAKRQELAFPLPEDWNSRAKKQRTVSGASGKVSRRALQRSSPLSSITEISGSGSDSEEDEEDSDESSSSQGDKTRPARTTRTSRHERQPTHRKVSQAEKTRKMLMKLAADEATSSESGSGSEDSEEDEDEDEDSGDARARAEREEEERRRAKRKAAKERAEKMAASARESTKKVKRLVETSDSESSTSGASNGEDERGARDETPPARSGDASVEVKKEEEGTAAPPTPTKEPEQPRAKMSLAEYRKRLMEKRHSTSTGEDLKPSSPSSATAPGGGIAGGGAEADGDISRASSATITPRPSISAGTGSAGVGALSSGPRLSLPSIPTRASLGGVSPLGSGTPGLPTPLSARTTPSSTPAAAAGAGIGASGGYFSSSGATSTGLTTSTSLPLVSSTTATSTSIPTSSTISGLAPLSSLPSFSARTSSLTTSASSPSLVGTGGLSGKLPSFTSIPSNTSAKLSSQASDATPTGFGARSRASSSSSSSAVFASAASGVLAPLPSLDSVSASISATPAAASTTATAPNGRSPSLTTAMPPPSLVPSLASFGSSSTSGGNNPAVGPGLSGSPSVGSGSGAASGLGLSKLPPPSQTPAAAASNRYERKSFAEAASSAVPSIGRGSNTVPLGGGGGGGSSNDGTSSIAGESGYYHRDRPPAAPSGGAGGPGGYHPRSRGASFNGDTAASSSSRSPEKGFSSLYTGANRSPVKTTAGPGAGASTTTTSPAIGGFAPISGSNTTTSTAGGTSVGTSNIPSFDPPKGPRALMAASGAGGSPSSAASSVPPSAAGGSGAGGQGRIPTGPRGFPVREEGETSSSSSSSGAPPAGGGLGLRGVPPHSYHHSQPHSHYYSADYNDESGGGPPPPSYPPRGRGRGGGFYPSSGGSARGGREGSGFQPPPRGSGWGGRARVRGGPPRGGRGGRGWYRGGGGPPP